MSITEDIVIRRLETIQKTLDIHIKDSDIEAKENQDYRIKVLALEGQVEELRKQLKHWEDKIQNKVAETIEPLREQIQDKKIIEYKVKPFWKRLFRR